MSRGARDLSRREWELLAESMVQLAAARVSIQLVAFRRIAAALPSDASESASDVGAVQAVLAREVGRAIDAAARRLKPADTCLARSVAAQRMLRRRGVASTLYLGVRRGAGDVLPHAWLRCGGEIVTGGDRTDGYAVVGRFVSRGPRVPSELECSRPEGPSLNVGRVIRVVLVGLLSALYHAIIPAHRIVPALAIMGVGSVALVVIVMGLHVFAPFRRRSRAARPGWVAASAPAPAFDALSSDALMAGACGLALARFGIGASGGPALVVAAGVGMWAGAKLCRRLYGPRRSGP